MAELVAKMVVRADPSPTIEMFRLMAQCHRENADQFDAMCDQLTALWAKQTENDDPS